MLKIGLDIILICLLGFILMKLFLISFLFYSASARESVSAINSLCLKLLL